MRCDTDFDAGACTVIIIPTRLLLMKKQKGPRTLRSRPPINACPDATPSDARLNAASAPKVIVIAKTPVHGGFTQGKGGIQRKHLSVPLCKKRGIHPKTNAAGMSSSGSATVGSPQRFLFPISSTLTSARHRRCAAWLFACFHGNRTP